MDLPLTVATNIAITNLMSETTYTIPANTHKLTVQVLSNIARMKTAASGDYITLIVGVVYPLGPNDNLSGKKLYFDDAGLSATVEIIAHTGKKVT